MKIPVTKDKENQTKLIALEMNDVLYIDIEDRTVVYHTLEEKYYHLSPSLSSLSVHLEQIGFQKLDRINLVNIHKIKHYDDEHRKVYFEEKVTRSSEFATVSYLSKKKLKSEIDEWINKNLDFNT